MRQTILEILMAAFGLALVAKGIVGISEGFAELEERRLEQSRQFHEMIRRGYGN